MMNRNLVATIDAIVAVAPDLAPILNGRRTSCLYTAPEAMPLRWQEVADLLNCGAHDHPNRKQIAAIFSGKSKL